MSTRPQKLIDDFMIDFPPPEGIKWSPVHGVFVWRDDMDDEEASSILQRYLDTLRGYELNWNKVQTIKGQAREESR